MMSPKETKIDRIVPASVRRHTALSEFLLGDLTSIQAGLDWFRRLENCKTTLASHLLQVLDCSDRSQHCRDTALRDLRASVNQLNLLLVEGLNAGLSCFSARVRRRLDPFVIELLTLTNKFLARYFNRQKQPLDPSFDALSAAFRVLGRECQPLVTTLVIAQQSWLLETPVKIQNDARDAWLYDEFNKTGPDGYLIAYKNITLAFRQVCKQEGWSYVGDISSMKRAAARWARRHGRKPIPKRQSGRRSKPK